MNRILTCIRCPIGCRLEAGTGAAGEVVVSGNQCPNGAAYARAELSRPLRMLTSTVRVLGAPVGAVPVKSSAPLPRDGILDCVRALKGVSLRAPVALGDVVVPGVCGSGVDIVASRSLPEAESEGGEAHG